MQLADNHQSAPTNDARTVSAQVEALLASLNPGVIIERRRHVRVAIPVLFRLTPLDDDRQPIRGKSLVVVGKNISQRGFSFVYNRPVSYRRARLTLIQPGLGQLDAELDIRWCRFTGSGWYESGGRLVRAASREWLTAESDLPIDES